jgi:hypothetical protein
MRRDMSPSAIRSGPIHLDVHHGPSSLVMRGTATLATAGAETASASLLAGVAANSVSTLS